MITRTSIITFIITLTIAAPLFAVEIEPQRLELSLSPGESHSAIIEVTNWLDYAVKLEIKPDYYRQMLTDNTIKPEGENSRLPSCQGWLSFEPNNIELSSRASMLINCAIDVPEGATEEHFASILFDESSLVSTFKQHPSKENNLTLEVIPRFTIPVYISIQDKENVSAVISDMSIDEGPSFDTLRADITLHNTGTVHIRPSGSLVLIDSRGNIARTLRIGECLPIFPDYKEKIPVYMAGEPIAAGAYMAICTINIGDGKLVQRKMRFNIGADYVPR